MQNKNKGHVLLGHDLCFCLYWF